MPVNSCFHNKMHFCDRLRICLGFLIIPRCDFDQETLKSFCRKPFFFSFAATIEVSRRRKKIFRRRGTLGPPYRHLVDRGGLIKRGSPIIAARIAASRFHRRLSVWGFRTGSDFCVSLFRTLEIWSSSAGILCDRSSIRRFLRDFGVHASAARPS